MSEIESVGISLVLDNGVSEGLRRLQHDLAIFDRATALRASTMERLAAAHLTPLQPHMPVKPADRSTTPPPVVGRPSKKAEAPQRENIPQPVVLLPRPAQNAAPTPRNKPLALPPPITLPVKTSSAPALPWPRLPIPPSAPGSTPAAAPQKPTVAVMSRNPDAAAARQRPASPPAASQRPTPTAPAKRPEAAAMPAQNIAPKPGGSGPASPPQRAIRPAIAVTLSSPAPSGPASPIPSPPHARAPQASISPPVSLQRFAPAPRDTASSVIPTASRTAPKPLIAISSLVPAAPPSLSKAPPLASRPLNRGPGITAQKPPSTATAKPPAASSIKSVARTILPPRPAPAVAKQPSPMPAARIVTATPPTPESDGIAAAPHPSAQSTARGHAFRPACSAPQPGRCHVPKPGDHRRSLDRWCTARPLAR